ncbi:MAG: cell division protein FtsL [Plasticicumulans sp.]|nr:cell division protein FtsL [Pseudomonadota bacterium]RTK95939.1 MAG: cell division protein FtsL [Xanthomonadales bacterium]
MLVLVLTILATGVGIVWSKHQSRKLFVELQGLQKVRDDLDIEWNQLQLEQSTLATESVIDQAARTRLDMGIPAPEAVIYVIR